jgi:molecular chaperone GrpE
MSGHDHPEHGSDEEEEEESRRVKVTEKRRVHLDPPAGGGEPPAPADTATSVQSEADEARAKAAEYLDHLQRLQAEFDNYRKRVLREQTRAVDLAAEPLVRKLLEVMDEFDLALMSAEKQPDFDRFLHGVELVYAKLQEILRQEGLERIEAQGKAFDPTRHEALLESQGEGGTPDGEPVVVDVMRPGYTLRGQVIRPAGVKVARR